MRLEFAASPGAWAYHDHKVREIAARADVRRVCDVGGGANPALPLDVIAAHGLEYVLLDISESELAKAPNGYVKHVADITASASDALGPYDLVITRSVLEHIRDPEAMHRRTYSLLAPGGWAVHRFPTLYSVPFVANRLLPDAAAEKVLLRIAPGRVASGPLGKFPAHYRWCRGPSRRQAAKFERLGFEVEEFVGWFGHDYYRAIPILRDVRLRGLLQRHPIPALTSFAVLVLRRRRGSQEAGPS